MRGVYGRPTAQRLISSDPDDVRLRDAAMLAGTMLHVAFVSTLRPGRP